MKKLILSFISLSFVFSVIGQEQLNKLKAPSSPAASLIEVQPSIILQPKSFKALETALYSNIKDSNGSIVPNNFGLEFMPFWATDHGLSIMEYLYPKTGFDQIVRNSSISIASTQNFALGNGNSSEALAIGYRTSLYFSNKFDREKTKSQIDSIRSIQIIQVNIGSKLRSLVLNEQKSTEQFIDTFKIIVRRELDNSKQFSRKSTVDSLVHQFFTNLPVFNKENPSPYIDSLKSNINNNIGSQLVYDNFEAYLKNRQGFVLDFAASTLLNFPTSNFEFSYAPRTSFWITPTYNFGKGFDFLKILGVLRYDWYNLDYYQRFFSSSTTYENSINFGLALNTEFDKISLMFELVGRSSNTEIPAGFDAEGNELFRKESESDVQYMGSVTYNIGDDIVLSYSLGKQFDPIINPKNTLISLLSLNLGFGGPTNKDLDYKK